MIGISFRVENECDTPLKQIFENISITEYFWKIKWSEVYKRTDTGLGSNLFDKDIMTGKEFQNDMSTDKYYMIFLTALAFVNEKDVININNYFEFKNSNCEIAINCSDTEFIVILSKCNKVLEQIMENCRTNDFKELEVLTEENVDGFYMFT